MESTPKVLSKAIEQIAKLPGIGKRTAFRLALHLYKQENEEIAALLNSISEMHENLQQCETCYNLSDNPTCTICSNPKRDPHKICVVEDIRDVLAIENTSEYNGLYHVLGGKISPIDGVGVDDLTITHLMKRISNDVEIIFAMSSTVEADTTILYIYTLLTEIHSALTFSKIASGVAVGEDLEYADSVTLARSISHRTAYNG